MTTKTICAVRDRAIDSFGQPIYVHTNAQAARMFRDEINREGSEMGAHPEDFDLYEIGSYNEETAKLEALSTPRLISIGKDQKKTPIE